MLVDFRLPAQGLTVEARRQDVLANNLANGNTPGFLRDTVVVESEPAARPPSRGALPAPRIAAVVARPAPGGMRVTGSPLDIAVSGEAYLTLQSSEGVRLSRGGAFTRQADGTVTDPAGRALLGQGGPIQITGVRIEISPSGVVSVDGSQVDTIAVRGIAPGAALQKTADGLLMPAGGEAELTTPETYGVFQGYLEDSAVNPVSEMVEMIAVLRAYEAGIRTVQAFDDALGLAEDRLGRLV